MIKPNKIIINCGLAVLLPFLTMGINIASASEVTGTINSNGTVTTTNTSTSTGTIQGSVGTSSGNGSLSGTVVGGSQATGTIGGGVGGSTITGTVTGGTPPNGGGGGGGGNGPISTNIPNNGGGGGIILGATDTNTNNPGGGLVLGVSTSTTPEFPTTGFGPNNLLQILMLLTLLVAVPAVSLGAFLQKKRKKFMQSRRINEFNVIDESIFSQ